MSKKLLWYVILGLFCCSAFAVVATGDRSGSVVSVNYDKIALAIAELEPIVAAGKATPEQVTQLAELQAMMPSTGTSSTGSEEQEKAMAEAAKLAAETKSGQAPNTSEADEAMKRALEREALESDENSSNGESFSVTQEVGMTKAQALEEAFQHYLRTGELEPSYKEDLIDRIEAESTHGSHAPLDDSGYDPYGYSFVDNINGGTATYGWIELCGDPSATILASTDDSEHNITLSFNFPFYGVTSNLIRIGANGGLHHNTTTADWALTNATTLSTTNTTGYIGPFWDDMDGDGAGPVGSGCNEAVGDDELFFRDFGTYAVIEWKKIPHYNESTDRYSYQAILYDDGRIKFQYNGTDWVNGTTGSVSSTILLDGAMATGGMIYLANGVPASRLPLGDRAIEWNPPGASGKCCYGDPYAPSCSPEDLTTCLARMDDVGWTVGSDCTEPCAAYGRCCYGSLYLPSCSFEPQAACLARSDDQSWTANTDCTTPCVGLPCDVSPPWSANFDAPTVVPALPDCWLQQNIDADTYFWKTATTYYHSAPNACYVGGKIATTATNDWLFTPPVSLIGGSTYQLKYWYRTSSTGTNAITYNVQYGTTQDYTGMTSGTLVASTNVSTTTWTQVSVSFVPAVTDEYYIGWNTTMEYYSLYIDDIEVNEVPEHDFATTSITAPPAVNRFDPGVSVPVTAIVQNVGTTTEAGTVSYSFNGGAAVTEATVSLALFGTETHTFATNFITPATNGTYPLKVWTTLTGDVIAANDTAYVNVVVFDCSNTPIPWTEGFESPTVVPALPLCWARQSVDLDAVEWITATGTAGTTTHTGTQTAKHSYSTGTIVADDWMFTTGFQLTAGQPYSFEYWYRKNLSTTTYVEWLEVKVGSAQNAASMSITIDPAFSFTGTPVWASHAVSFTPATSGTYYIGIHYLTSVNQGGVLVDDISLAEGEFTGRCCYGALGAGGCAIETQALCEARANYYSWTNGITSCVTDPCPILGRCCYSSPYQPLCALETEAVCLARTNEIDWTVGVDCTTPCEPLPCTPHWTLTDAGVITDANGTCGDGANYNNGCLGYYDGGEENIIEWTVTAGGEYSVVLATTTTYTGIALSTTCSADSFTCLAQATNSGAGGVTIPCTLVNPGTYYIFVDTWPAPACISSYTLTITACIPCPAECPPEGIAEGEPDCSANYVDATNGGCNSTPNVFGAIECNQTICGTTGTFLVGTTQTRDTDWYLLTLTSPMDVTWAVSGDYSKQAIIYREGSTDLCTGRVALSTVTAARCVTATATAAALNPGNYLIYTSPTVFTGIPCGTPYLGVLTCTPYVPPVGRCCYNGTANCVDNISLFDCTTLHSGSWTQGITCDEECPELPPCPISFSDCTDPDEYISNVNFNLGVINNTSIQDCPNHYGNYSFLTAPVIASGVYPLDITVTCPGSSWTQYVSVLIDWNLNSIWDLATELVNVGTFAVPAGGSHVFSTAVNVPVDALEGMPYMRIITKESAYTTTGCDAGTYGEAEDYRLQVGPTECDRIDNVTVIKDVANNVFDLNWTVLQATTHKLYYTTNPNNDGNPDGPDADPFGGDDPDFSSLYLGTLPIGPASYSIPDTAVVTKYYNFEVAAEDCGPIPPSGRCCYNTTECVVTDQVDCLDNFTGIWSYGLDCDDTPLCGDIVYCEPCYTQTTGFDDWIENVTFNTLNYNSLVASTPCKYDDQTALSTTVIQGATHTISVTINGDGLWDETCRVWFDWNHDGTFSAGEGINVGCAEILVALTPVTITTSVTVPVDATIGTTRMRVSERYSSGCTLYPEPCETTTYGESEDFSIVIVAP